MHSAQSDSPSSLGKARLTKVKTFVVQDISVVAAVNDQEILEMCLLASPDLKNGIVPFRPYWGYERSGVAFNAALADCATRVLVIVHQDVYLPLGFAERLTGLLDHLELLDPNWAIVGSIGIDNNWQVHGEAWASSVQKVVGRAGELPAIVESLDEMVLILRTDAGIGFDPDIPSFHLYGTDVVQSAKLARRTSYVVHLPVIHHSRPLTSLGGGYREAYKYCRTKWASILPVPTLLRGLELSPLPLLRYDLTLRVRSRGRRARPLPAGDPRQIAREIGYDASE